MIIIIYYNYETKYLKIDTKYKNFLKEEKEI